MAEYYNNQQEEGVAEKVQGGLFEFGKKEKHEDLIPSEFEDKVMVSDQPQEEVEKNHNTSFTSSNKEEEYFENEEEKSSEEKLPASTIAVGEGDYVEQYKADESDTRVPVENIRDNVYDEERVENIKEKLPGGNDDLLAGDDVEFQPPRPAEVAVEEDSTVEEQQQDKKGFLDKIKDKIPGFNSKPNTPYEEEKEEAIE